MSIGIWKVEESLADFSTFDVFADVCGRYANDGRRMEVLCTCALLRRMTGDATLRVAHDALGAPYLVSGVADGPLPHVGISHTVGWVAVVLSAERRVAVDVEFVSTRVKRVAARFLRPDEPFGTLEAMLVAWCAKETAYKLLPELKLGFADMRLRPFTPDVDGSVPGVEGSVTMELLRGDRRSIDVGYFRTSQFVLAWSTVPASI